MSKPQSKGAMAYPVSIPLQPKCFHWLGIQIHLVPELQASTTQITCKKIINLQSLQANFLAETEMTKLYIQQPSKLNKSQLYAPLRAILSKATHPIKPTQQLIHAICQDIRFLVQSLLMRK